MYMYVAEGDEAIIESVCMCERKWVLWVCMCVGV